MPPKKAKTKPLQPVILSDEQLRDSRVSLGAKLRLLRKSRGLTMDKVCEDLNIRKAQLSLDEANPIEFDMGVSRLLKYCAYYGVEVVVFDSNFKIG